MWCIPPRSNAEFVAAMEDVLDVYEQPYDPRRPQVCVDETCKQLVGATRAPLAASPGQPLRYDFEYVRNGTANLFLAFEPLAGQRQVAVTATRRRSDWAQFIRDLVDGPYRDADRVVLVMDQLNIHSVASLYECFEPAEARRLAQKLEIHFTPKHGSWLNMAEIDLSILSRQCLGRRIPDRLHLERGVALWQAERNRRRSAVDWRFTNSDARIRLKRLYPSFHL